MVKIVSSWVIDRSMETLWLGPTRIRSRDWARSRRSAPTRRPSAVESRDLTKVRSATTAPVFSFSRREKISDIDCVVSPTEIVPFRRTTAWIPRSSDSTFMPILGLKPRIRGIPGTLGSAVGTLLSSSDHHRAPGDGALLAPHFALELQNRTEAPGKLDGDRQRLSRARRPDRLEIIDSSEKSPPPGLRVAALQQERGLCDRLREQEGRAPFPAGRSAGIGAHARQRLSLPNASAGGVQTGVGGAHHRIDEAEGVGVRQRGESGLVVHRLLTRSSSAR